MVLTEHYSKVISNDKIQELVNALRTRMFGSITNFDKYRDSRKSFPKQYKDVCNLIVMGYFPEEVYLNLIGACDRALIITGSHSSSGKEVVDGEKGTRSKSIKMDDVTDAVIEDFNKEVSKTTKKEVIKKAKAKDPTLYTTYKERISVQISLRRRQKLGLPVEDAEAWIRKYAEIYTERYNEEFGTSFSCYISKRRIKK